MCLSTLSEPFDVEQDKEGNYIGYKVMDRCGDTYLSVFFVTSENLERDKWYDEKDVRMTHYPKPTTSGNEKYPFGWSIFTDLENASFYRNLWGGVVVKVLFKKILAYGYQYHRFFYNRHTRCVIARHMKIIGEVNV